MFEAREAPPLPSPPLPPRTSQQSSSPMTTEHTTSPPGPRAHSAVTGALSLQPPASARAAGGGPANDLPAPPLAARPAWSVLSLHDLNEKIRDELRVDNPVRWQLQLAREERQAAQARQRAADNITAAARATRDLYRNAWE